MIKKIETILKGLRPELDFRESNDFFEDGLLDSFELVLLVTELENTFEIKIDGAEIVPENFNNLVVIKSLVDKSK